MAVTPVSPVQLEGRLDRELSRWLWLVKVLLAIPHYILLGFLWIAFFVLTVIVRLLADGCVPDRLQTRRPPGSVPGGAQYGASAG